MGIILVHLVRGSPRLLWARLNQRAKSNSGDGGIYYPRRHEVASMQAPPYEKLVFNTPFVEVFGRDSTAHRTSGLLSTNHRICFECGRVTPPVTPI